MKRNNYLFIVVCSLSVFLFSLSSLFAEFAGGKGTFMEPWLIETAEHLSNVRNYLGAEHSQKFFKQVANIDLDVAPWNTGDGWEPIGIAGKHFYGTYDGDGHAVTGLYIKRPNTKNVGLFGFCMNANIKNLRVINFDVEGDTWVGGLVGDFSGSESNPSGGVGRLTNCFASGKVKGVTRVGGLAGYSVRSEINRCGAIAEITSIHSTESYAGGLIGFVSTNGKVSNCYAFGVVTSQEEASGCGGLIGCILSTTVSKSYSTTSAVGGKEFGGLIGLTEQSNCSYCYWDMTASMTNESKGGEGRTTEKMTFPHGHNTYVGWDFTETWFADVTKEVNNGYPYHGSYTNIPYAAKKPEPANGEKGVDINASLIWVPDLNGEFNNMPNGFYLSFGTDNPPTNIIDKVDLKWATEYEFDAPLKIETT